MPTNQGCFAKKLLRVTNVEELKEPEDPPDPQLVWRTFYYSLSPILGRHTNHSMFSSWTRSTRVAQFCNVMVAFHFREYTKLLRECPCRHWHRDSTQGLQPAASLPEPSAKFPSPSRRRSSCHHVSMHRAYLLFGILHNASFSKSCTRHSAFGAASAGLVRSHPLLRTFCVLLRRQSHAHFGGQAQTLCRQISINSTTKYRRRRLMRVCV